MLAAIPAQAQTTGGVRGFVRESFVNSDRRGPAIVGATVTAVGRNGFASATSDAHGFYVLWGLAPGVYEVIADAKGYVRDAAGGRREICIHAGNQEYVELTVLQPARVMWNDDRLRHLRYEELKSPSKTQTADLYSVGDC